MQGELFGSPPVPADGRPAGFSVVPDFITAAEERELLALFPRWTFRPFVLMGQPSRRRIAVFGYHDSTEVGVEQEVPPIPDELIPLRDHCVRALTGEEPARYLQAVVTEYPPGAGITWHRDYPVYGPTVLGVSLGAPCRFRLRRTRAPDEVFAFEMPPRCAYAMSGESRRAWQHAITPVKATRWSVTFRTLR